MKKLVQMIVVASATLLGGCAWLDEQPYYIPGGAYVQRIWVPHGGYVEGGRRYYYDGDRRYYYDGNRRYYEDGGRRHYIDALQREAHEEREFIKNVGKTQMEARERAAKAQAEMRKEEAKMKMKAAQAQMKVQQQAAQAKAQQQAAKARMKAADKAMKR